MKMTKTIDKYSKEKIVEFYKQLKEELKEKNKRLKQEIKQKEQFRKNYNTQIGTNNVLKEQLRKSSMAYHSEKFKLKNLKNHMELIRDKIDYLIEHEYSQHVGIQGRKKTSSNTYLSRKRDTRKPWNKNKE